jgi:hypothetical protein
VALVLTVLDVTSTVPGVMVLAQARGTVLLAADRTDVVLARAR